MARSLSRREACALAGSATLALAAPGCSGSSSADSADATCTKVTHFALNDQETNR
jgi:ABC-type glycerol-3-phosphate transport system substrate-binding protein